jgi:hypothetical protein
LSQLFLAESAQKLFFATMRIKSQPNAEKRYFLRRIFVYWLRSADCCHADLPIDALPIYRNQILLLSD